MSAPHLVFLETSASGSGLGALRRARDRHGFDVTFCTGHRDYFEALPGAEVLEEVQILEVDTFDPAAVISRLVSEGPPPSGVIALDDYHLLSASLVTSHFGLPGHSYDGLKRARRKDLMRFALAEAGCPQPEFWIIDHIEDAAALPEGRPLVVKPVDDSGSVGVRVCHTPREVREALDYALSRSVNVRGYRLTPRCLVETYVKGPEYSAELVNAGSRWELIGFTTKEVVAGAYPIEMGHAFPSDLGGADRLVGAQIVNWLNALGLDWGAAHVEFKLCGGAAVPIEINPRLAGNRITELVALVSGVDPTDRLLAMAVGHPCENPAAPAHPAAAISFLLPPQAGLITGVTGWSTVDTAQGVHSSGSAKKLPVMCDKARSDYDYLAYVVATGGGVSEAQRLADAAVGLLNVEYG